MVDSLYPNGGAKLYERLTDALDGRAQVHVLSDMSSGSLHGLPVGLAAETPKGDHQRKISTFWVHPDFRGAGLGRMLLDHRIGQWLRSDIESAVVTVRAERAPELMRLFQPRGFVQTCVVTNRYGIGRDEVILSWSPSNPVSFNAAA